MLPDLRKFCHLLELGSEIQDTSLHPPSGFDLKEHEAWTLSSDLILSTHMHTLSIPPPLSFSSLFLLFSLPPHFPNCYSRKYIGLIFSGYCPCYTYYVQIWVLIVKPVYFHFLCTSQIWMEEKYKHPKVSVYVAYRSLHGSLSPKLLQKWSSFKKTIGSWHPSA